MRKGIVLAGIVLLAVVAAACTTTQRSCAGLAGDELQSCCSKQNIEKPDCDGSWAYDNEAKKCVFECEQKPKEGFCGSSTNAACSTNDDCAAAGCSGQICTAKSQGPVMTTCEYRECYNAAAYNLECSCVSNQCQWAPAGS